MIFQDTISRHLDIHLEIQVSVLKRRLERVFWKTSWKGVLKGCLEKTSWNKSVCLEKTSWKVSWNTNYRLEKTSWNGGVLKRRIEMVSWNTNYRLEETRDVSKNSLLTGILINCYHHPYAIPVRTHSKSSSKSVTAVKFEASAASVSSFVPMYVVDNTPW